MAGDRLKGKTQEQIVFMFLFMGLRQEEDLLAW